MPEARHVEEVRLNARAMDFAQHYAKVRGIDPSLDAKQKLNFLNAAIAGFYAGVRFTEDHEQELYGKAPTNGHD